MVNHCVILNAIDAIKYDWSQSIRALLKWQSDFAFMAANNISFSCLIVGAGRSHSTEFQTFFKELVFAVCWPVVVLLWFAFLIFVSSCCRRARFDHTKFTCAAVVTVWLFQPDVAQAIFASVSCIERDGKYWLFNDLDIRCWEGEHRNFVYYVSLPAFIIWIIAPPVIFFCILKGNIKDPKEPWLKSWSQPNENISQIKEKSTMMKRDRFKVESYQLKYGFLFGGFKEEVFYWELVVMTRKICVIFATEFLTSVSSEVQVLVSILIIIASIMSIIKIKPFLNNETNFSNIYSQQVQMLMMYIGLFYMTGHDREYMADTSKLHWILIPLVVVPSAAFFARWLGALLLQTLILLHMKNK